MPCDINFLIEGYRKFKEEYFEEKSHIYEDLTRYGQQPNILFIACSDSRVDPAIVTRCQPGELFVVRNVANLVPPYETDHGYHGTSAALEFAVCTLEIKHIIVFGHTQCGGITSLFQKPLPLEDHKGFLSKWMQLARPAFNKVQKHHKNCSLEDKITICEQYSLINSLKNLKTFPWIKERIQKDQLCLHAWYFDLPTGTIKRYSSETNDFVELF